MEVSAPMPTKPKGQGKRSRVRDSKAQKERQKRVKRAYQAGLPVAANTGETSPRTGRPSMYSETLANEILTELACGKTLTEVCEREDMPGYTTVLSWRRKYPDFDRAYALAREDGIHQMAESTVVLGDQAIDDEDPKKAQAYQVAIKARQWFAGKLMPSVYGDNVEVRHSGGVQVRELRGLDDDTLAALRGVLQEAVDRQEASPSLTIDGEAEAVE